MNKPKNPLSGMKKKEKSYIGNLDDLMKDTVDEDLSERESPDAAQRGEEGSTDTAPADSSDSASVGSPKEEGGAVSDEGTSPELTMKEAASETSPEPEQDTKSYKHLNLKIDATLHRQFKGIVGMQGTTMTDVLEGMISRYVEEKKSELL